MTSPDRLTESELSELERLEREATPGPWIVDAGDDECCSSVSGVVSDSERQRLQASNRVHRGDFPEDTRWIVVDPGCSPVIVVDNFDFIAALEAELSRLRSEPAVERPTVVRGPLKVKIEPDTPSFPAHWALLPSEYVAIREEELTKLSPPHWQSLPPPPEASE